MGAITEPSLQYRHIDRKIDNWAAHFARNNRFRSQEFAFEWLRTRIDDAVVSLLLISIRSSRAYVDARKRLVYRDLSSLFLSFTIIAV
jgi:hypothetical protein